MTVLTCAAIGYASIDWKYATARFEGEGRTTIIRRPLSERPEPGAVWYFARALARHEHAVNVVTWVGADETGRGFIEHNRVAGIGIDGIAVCGVRSPACHMYYSDSGASVVYYDPGRMDQHLHDQQQRIVAEADVVLVGIGPPSATAEALGMVRDDALVMWAVKSDPSSLPPELAGRLADRADVICHNEPERTFLSQHGQLDLDAIVAGGTPIVMTSGPGEVLVRNAGGDLLVPGPPRVDALDATGAGDTFAGSLLARLVAAGLRRNATISQSALHAAIVGACDDACTLLMARHEGR